MFLKRPVRWQRDFFNWNFKSIKSIKMYQIVRCCYWTISKCFNFEILHDDQSSCVKGSTEVRFLGICILRNFMKGTKIQINVISRWVMAEFLDQTSCVRVKWVEIFGNLYFKVPFRIFIRVREIGKRTTYNCNWSIDKK